MIIKGIKITQFRGFRNVQFELGSSLTVIAGQNGTQKTTLMGMLSQPFSISEKANPLFGERPLSGGNYRSSFAEKFKLSEKFDKPQSHEWTLYLNDSEEPEFTVESIKRESSASGIRFWQKGTHAKGSGYIPIPVIYLSLARLAPIGEDAKIGANQNIVLSAVEQKFYQDWHNKILIIPDVQLTSVDYLSSTKKNTLGANTSYYDWRMNSSGQDNIGKILLSILSFKRLKEKFPKEYKGGILAIDELDATLYPASQIKLLEAFRKFSSEFKIQIIFTTHSLSILEKACEWQEERKFAGQVVVAYLQKYDSSVKLLENISFDEIRNKLNVALATQKESKKIPLFTEDNEGKLFLKSILKSKGNKHLKFMNCTMGCGNYLELAKKKIPPFKFPQSLIVLDGDVRTEPKSMKVVQELKNILVLPGKKSPEQLISQFLYDLPDESSYWDKIEPGYTKQFVFRDQTLLEIQNDRVKSKIWFRAQMQHWGSNCSKVMNLWIKENQVDVEVFLSEYERLIENYSKYL